MELTNIDESFLTCENCERRIKDKEYVIISLGRIKAIQNYSNIFSHNQTMFDFEKYDIEDLKYSNVNMDIESLSDDLIFFHKSCFGSVSGGEYFNK